MSTPTPIWFFLQFDALSKKCYDLWKKRKGNFIRLKKTEEIECKIAKNYNFTINTSLGMDNNLGFFHFSSVKMFGGYPL